MQPSTPSPREASAVRSSEQTPGFNVGSLAVRHIDEAHGDERHYQTIDMTVWDSHVEHGKLIVVVALPREMDPHSVDHHWTGIFTSDGKPISGTDIVVAGVTGHAIRVGYSGATLPSRTVRLYPRSDAGSHAPDVPHRDEARGDEAHYHPLDLKVFDTRPDGAKLRVRIELPQHMSAGSVDVRWTGVFTRDGKEIAGTEFKVAGAIGHAIFVEYPGSSIPSRTVRLFHPKQ